MTVGERIKELRKSKNMTQQELGDRIKITKASLSRIESGINNPSEQTLTLICSEFGISDKWLRTGEGEMYTASQDSLLGDLIAQFQLDDFDQQLVIEYLKLSKDKRAVFKEYLEHVTAAISDDKGPFDDIPDTPEELEKMYPPIELGSSDVG